MPESDSYRIYAVKYAHHERNASVNFLGGDPHDGPMPMDYFVWAVVGDEKTFIVDTGFDPEVGNAVRGRSSGPWRRASRRSASSPSGSRTSS